MPTAYPLPPTAGAPTPIRCYERAPDYQVTEGPEYGDGGRDTFLGGTTPTRVWVLEYQILTQAKAAVLDAHHASAFGKHLTFNFTDPNTGTTHGNVKYLSYEAPPHDKVWSLRRTVTLVKRP